MSCPPADDARHNGRVRPVFGLLLAVIGLFLINNLLIGTLFDWPSRQELLQAILLGTAIGVVIGQLNLISIWAAIAEGPIIVRLPWAYLLVVVIWASVAVGNVLSDGIDHEAIWTLGAMLALGCTVAQAPLWIASRWFRWRLIGPGRVGEQADDVRFNLKHLFIGTFFLAVVLGFCRFIFLSVEGDIQFITDGDLYVGLSIMAVVNLVTVVPAIWAAFLWPLSWQSALAGVAAVGSITVIQVVIFSFLFGGGDIEEYLAFWAINLAQVLAVYVTLRAMRRFGFKLARCAASS